MGLWACAIQPRRQSMLHCRWSPANHSDDSENALATSITLSLLKEIITYKSSESMNLILKLKFQVLSVINQFKNDYFI